MSSSQRSLMRQRRMPISADDPRRSALLESTERLLRDQPLAQLTVDQISIGAGLTRTAFYVYFGRREDAVAALSVRYFTWIFEGRKPFFSEELPLEDTCREAIRNEVAIWREHGAVLRSLADTATTDAQMRDAWFEQVEQFIAPVEARIVSHALQRGAPPPPHPRIAAEALVWMAERYYYVWSSKGSTDEDVVVDALTPVMLGMMTGGTSDTGD